MSLDRTLKTHGGLAKSRSVMSRAERIAHLADDDKFDMEHDSPLGLPKIKVRHSRAGTKSKKAEEKPPTEEAPAGVDAAQGKAAVTEAPEKGKPEKGKPDKGRPGRGKA